MTQRDMDITLVGDEELQKILKQLDYKTQHKFLKRVVNDAGQKTVVKDLKRDSPRGETGNLRRSMGTVRGKSRRNATVFAGPRMGGKHKGWVANILENAKPNRRYPKNAKALKIGDNYVKSVGPIKKKTTFRQTIKAAMPAAERHMIKSVRTILEREIRKYKRTR